MSEILLIWEQDLAVITHLFSWGSSSISKCFMMTDTNILICSVVASSCHCVTKKLYRDSGMRDKTLTNDSNGLFLFYYV